MNTFFYDNRDISFEYGDLFKELHTDKYKDIHEELGKEDNQILNILMFILIIQNTTEGFKGSNFEIFQCKMYGQFIKIRQSLN